MSYITKLKIYYVVPTIVPKSHQLPPSFKESQVTSLVQHSKSSSFLTQELPSSTFSYLSFAFPIHSSEPLTSSICEYFKEEKLKSNSFYLGSLLNLCLTRAHFPPHFSQEYSSSSACKETRGKNKEA